MEPIFLFELQEYNFWEKYSKEGVAYNTITSVILILGNVRMLMCQTLFENVTKW